MSFVPDINVHGGHAVMYRHRETPTTASPDLKLGSRYQQRRIELEMPKDDDAEVSSSNTESLADSGFLDAEENYHEFKTMRQRAEFAYGEIRRTAVEATEAVLERENFANRKQFWYGTKSQWSKKDVEEEARLAKKGALASARLQRRFSTLLPRAVPKARRVLDFDREDGGERVPAHWSGLSRHELGRIFPRVYGEGKEPQDRPMSSTNLRKHIAQRVWSRAEIAQHFSSILERAKEDRAKSETSTLLTTYLKESRRLI